MSQVKRIIQSERICSLANILGIYLEGLETLNTTNFDWPISLHFMMGTATSARGPAGEHSPMNLDT